MAIGTRSLLFGVHCWLIHPLFVAYSWFRLYGFPYDPRLWFAFFLHDIGYWGKPNMDGPEGQRHVELGAAVIGFLFGPRWRDFTLLHSRSYARRLGRSPSPLCAADKMVVYYTPWWIYFPLARATGELHEYMAQSDTSLSGPSLLAQVRTFRAWYALLQRELKAWSDRHVVLAAAAAQPAADERSGPASVFGTARGNREYRPAVATLLGFCLPAMLGMGAEAAYHLTTRMSVGRALGPAGLAEITTAFPCSLLLLAFSLLFGCGAATVISLRLGQGNVAAAEQAFGATLVALSVAALGLTAAGLVWIQPLLGIFGADMATAPQLSKYLQILLAGAWFQLASFAFTAMIRAAGRPWTSGLLLLAGLLVNVAVTCVCLFVLHWGTAGVALGAVASYGFLTVAGVWCVTRRNAPVKLRLRNLRLRPELAGVLACGASAFLMQVATGAGSVLLNRQLQLHGGATALATMGVVYAVAMTIVLPTYGISAGIQPLVGFHYGARDQRSVRRALGIALLAATATTSAGFLAMTLIPGRLLALASGGADAALLAGGIPAMRFTALLLPLVGFQVVGLGYFQATGKSVRAALLAICRQTCLLVPAAFLLPRLLGLDGVWLAVPAADLGMFVITAAALLPEMRSLCRAGDVLPASRFSLGVATADVAVAECNGSGLLSPFHESRETERCYQCSPM